MKPKAVEEENQRLKKALDDIQVQRNILANGLRRICTAGSLIPGDPLDDAYRKAGGGYGGLQEIAVKALEIAGVDR